jgi:tetratricopeptide (TPR) repeat protein
VARGKIGSMRLALAAALATALATPVAAQQPAPVSPPAQAYFEFLLARRLESQGDTAGALAALKRAQGHDPKSAEILAELAGFHARQNEGSEAIDAAERALKIDPNNLEAHRMLGLVFAALSEAGGTPVPGRTQQQMRSSAIEHLTKILDTPAVATDLNLQLTLARLLLRSGRAERAVPVLENIVSQAPFAAEPYAMLGEARLSLGRIDGAIEAYEMAAEINPRNYAVLGDLYEKQGRWADAARSYEQALANPRAVTRELRMRYFMALLNSADKANAAKARDGLRDYLLTTPQDVRGLLLLSRAQLELGDFTNAEETARRLLAFDPTNERATHALADTLAARREYRKVVDLLTPFVQDLDGRSKGYESDAALLLSLLGHAHLELKEYDRAVSVLMTAVKRDPLSAPALNSLGYMLAERGERLPEAVGFIERALKVDPDNPSYLDSLGWALHKQGKTDEAEPHLRRAADALPTQSVIQDHYGDVLVKRGKIPEAIGAWERALAGDGTDIDRPVIEKKIKDAKGKQQ